MIEGATRRRERGRVARVVLPLVAVVLALWLWFGGAAAIAAMMTFDSGGRFFVAWPGPAPSTVTVLIPRGQLDGNPVGDVEFLQMKRHLDELADTFNVEVTLLLGGGEEPVEE